MIKIRYLYYMSDIDVVDLISVNYRILKSKHVLLLMGKINIMKCNNNLMLIG